MKKSIIVYGPQGCGKSKNAAILARYFGLEVIVDRYDPQHDDFNPYGVLYLSNAEPPEPGRAANMPGQHGRHYNYQDIMALINCR